MWSVMNRTKSKPGERLLRSWFARPSHDLSTYDVHASDSLCISNVSPRFARPTHDLSTLRERHAAIDFFVSPHNAQLLSQAQGLLLDAIRTLLVLVSTRMFQHFRDSRCDCNIFIHVLSQDPVLVRVVRGLW